MEIKILTLVIPTKNRFELLKTILVEIKKFKKEIDIIIVDDNSSVHVSKLIINLIKEFNNIRYFKLKKNKGQSFACNHGLKRCKSKYVWFFDDDDFLKKTTLKTLINFLCKKRYRGSSITNGAGI
jgi:glycosyltransferase involved in cell wall biosynthesis